jgi:hypothetical protein
MKGSHEMMKCRARTTALQTKKNTLRTSQERMVSEISGVISYNKKNLERERELQNESRQHSRQQGRAKRGMKKFNVKEIELYA